MVHRPPRRRDHAANVWLNPKCEHVSTAGVFPQGSYEMERDTGRVQIRSRSVVTPTDRQDPLWEHLCSCGRGGLSKFPELRGLVRDSSQHGDLRISHLSRFAQLAPAWLLVLSLSCMSTTGRSRLGLLGPVFPGLSFRIARMTAQADGSREGGSSPLGEGSTEQEQDAW